MWGVVGGGGVVVNVSVGVLVERNGTAMVGVGVGRGGCVGAGGSPGIVLALTVGGGWVLSNSTTLQGRVVEGSMDVRPGVWYRLGLVVRAGGTVATIDGKTVAQAPQLTTEQFHGWAAIGSSYDLVQFDDFCVDIEHQEGGASAALPSLRASGTESAPARLH